MLALALVAVVLSMTAGLGLVVGAQRHRHAAQSAADLAALAGAGTVAVPQGVVLAVAAADPCELAGEVVTRNGAQLVACSVMGGVVTVTATAGGPPLRARASARAGPAADRS